MKNKKTPNVSRAQAEFADISAMEKSPAALEYISAALERARVVGVLDGWATSTRSVGGGWRMTDLSPECTPTCTLYPSVLTREARHFTAATPDEARAKAAAAIEAGEV